MTPISQIGIDSNLEFINYSAFTQNEVGANSDDICEECR